MKRAYSLNTNKDEYLICEFHPAIKNKLYSDEKGKFSKFHWGVVYRKL